MTESEFWERVDRSGGGCWPWRLSLGSHGYGQTFWNGRVALAHRVAWELANGPLPVALTVDHLCHVKRCCNPAHLRLLSNVENARDNGQGRKTSCPAGHAYDGDNTYVNPKGHRFCRACAAGRRQRVS